MENKKFNFENYSRDLYEIEKDSQKKLVETNGMVKCVGGLGVREHR